jgi:Coenzyme PQQ synthesis protein D (PqqD)
MASMRLEWNVPAVTAERFDDEIVLVNFDSGKYHSIQGAGVDIWQWLELRPSVGRLLELSTARFGDDAWVEETVRAFLGDLEREGLIRLVAEDAAPAAPDADAVHDARVAFEPPALSTFSDMKELLLLDPIHEVDESGWPAAGGNGRIDE